MRTFQACLLVFGLGLVVGCPTKETRDKGPGAKKEVTISAPTEVVSLVRGGDSVPVDVTINRPAGFDEDVVLSVEMTAPPGKKKESVTPKLSKTTLKPGDDGKVTLTVTTTENAGAGEYKAIIRATPARAAPAQAEVKFALPRP